MPKTQVDLVDRVLVLAKLKGDGQTASAEEHQKATLAVETAHAKLEELEIAYWSLASIPDAVFEDVAAYSLGHAAADLVPRAERADYVAAGREAESEIRRITAKPATGEPMRSTYY